MCDRIYAAEADLPVVNRIGDVIRDAMVISYFAFAVLLIHQLPVETVPWQRLGESLRDLINARNEDEVLQHTFFDPNSIWHQIYINPENGVLRLVQGSDQIRLDQDSDQNYFKLMQQPLDCSKQQPLNCTEKGELKKAMQGRSQITTSNDPISFVVAPKGGVTYITCLWGNLQGSLVLRNRCKHLANDYYRKCYERVFNFLTRSNDANGLFLTANVPNLYPIIGAMYYKLGILDSEVELFRQSRIFNPQLPTLSSDQQHDSHECKTIHKSFSYVGFAIVFVLFSIIVVFSNVFAWAKIIEKAMMIKIITSGVGSVIGGGCLVGAIVLGCKNKICDNHSKTISYDQCDNGDASEMLRDNPQDQSI
jgi:hypothetical protein